MGKLSRETPPPREGEPMGAYQGVRGKHAPTTDRLVSHHLARLMLHLPFFEGTQTITQQNTMKHNRRSE